jgi:hypothetical protein
MKLISRRFVEVLGNLKCEAQRGFGMAGLWDARVYVMLTGSSPIGGTRWFSAVAPARWQVE